MKNSRSKLLQTRATSAVLSWFLVIVLTCGQVMAQELPAPNSKTIDLERYLPKRNFSNLDSSLVGPSILSALPPKPGPVGFDDPGLQAPGRTRVRILEILIIASAVAALILLLPHGGKDSSPPPQRISAPITAGPEGTVLSPGPPAVVPPTK